MWFGVPLVVLIAVLGVGGDLLLRQTSPNGPAVERTTTAAPPATAGPMIGPAAEQGGGPVERASADTAHGGAAACTVVHGPAPLPADMHETSGAAPSQRTPGVVWIQNDSRGPTVTAVGVDGGVRGRVRITGAQIEDWEDLAVARCGGASCMYVGDIGDNAAARPYVSVWRLPEPAPGDAGSAAATELRAAYPDGPGDAEAMLAFPDGSLFIVTKGETGRSAVYRFPARPAPGAVMRLEKIAQIYPDRVARPERITGGAVSPDGRWAALRTLRRVFFYRGDDFRAGNLSRPLEWDASALGEKQGEGIGIVGDGRVVLTSEGGRKKHDPATLSLLACRLP